VVATFGGLLNSGGRYFPDLLTPVKFYRYFRRVTTFGGSLLSKLYGSIIRSVLRTVRRVYMLILRLKRLKPHYEVTVGWEWCKWSKPVVTLKGMRMGFLTISGGMLILPLCF